MVSVSGPAGIGKSRLIGEPLIARPTIPVREVGPSPAACALLLDSQLQTGLRATDTDLPRTVLTGSGRR